MVQQAIETPRRGGLIAMAAAGVTLAAGVTVGGLLGWIRPPQAPAPATIEAPFAATVEEAAPAPPAPPEASPAIPAEPPMIDPDPAAEAEIEPAVLAMERPEERAERHRDHHARRDHHEQREHRGSVEQGEHEDRDED